MSPRLFHGFAVAALWLATVSLHAQAPAATEGPVVVLPPLLVESAKGPPWLYAATSDFEVLSRCSRGTTKHWVKTQQHLEQLLRVMVPGEFLAKMDVPVIHVLTNQASKRAESDAVLAEAVQTEKEKQKSQDSSGDHPAKPNQPGPSVQFLPNIRLEDRDAIALFALLNEDTFEGENLQLTPSYLFSRMSRRTPMLPPWVIVGVAGVFGEIHFQEDAIIILPTRWVSREAMLALRQNPETPRTLLPMAELFAAEGPGAGGQDNPRVRVWQAQAALFFRWALEGDNPARRAAFWKFAARVTSEPVTGALFQECFGVDFAEMRDQLSDYLPIAVKEPISLPVGKLPKLPSFDVRLASELEISRLKGEWERMEISYVKAHQPQFAARYIEQARRTLGQAYASGERDPRLLSSLGLCEIEARNDAGARPLLEAAVAAHVVRPRAYFELARLRRLALLGNDSKADKKFTALELEGVIAPLRTAWTQAPALPEVLTLLAQTLLRGAEAPSSADLALLANGARCFALQPRIAYAAAVVHAMYGQTDEASALVRQGLQNAPDAPIRERLIQLQTTLAQSALPDSKPAPTQARKTE